MKKLALLFLVVVLALLIIGGCSSEEQEADAINFQQVLAMVQAEQVVTADVVVKDTSYFLTILTKEGTKFTSEMPKDEGLLRSMQGKGIETSISRAPNLPWWTAYSGVLSILFISFPVIILIILILILIYLRRIFEVIKKQQ